MNIDYIYYFNLVILTIITSFYFISNITLKYPKKISFIILAATILGTHFIGLYTPYIISILLPIVIAFIFSNLLSDNNAECLRLIGIYALLLALSHGSSFLYFIIFNHFTFDNLLTALQSSVVYQMLINLTLFTFIVFHNIIYSKYDEKRKHHLLLVFLYINATEFLTFVGLFHENYSNTFKIMSYGFMCECLLLIMNYAIYRLFIDILMHNEEQKELAFLKQQQDFHTRYYEEVIVNAKEVSMIKHDINNHLQTIYSLIANNESDKAKELLDSLTIQLSNTTSSYFCDNKVVNTILVLKTQAAHASGITTKIDINVDSFEPLTDIDLCSLITNLYDNAIEASKNSEAKSIAISCRKQKQYLLLKVTNSCNQIINKSLDTTKADKKEHGYGLKIVERIVNSYNGDVIIDTDTPEQFTITIGIMSK